MASKRLELVITGDARKAQKALGDLDRAAGRTEKTTTKALSGIKGGIVDLGVASAGMFAFSEWNEAQKVGKQTEAVIRSTGQAAGVTEDEVGDLAETMSKKTGIDDEAIQAGENWLLTFKKVRNEAGEGNDIFDQTTETMVDLSVAMGSDAKTAANLLGKALNDPIKGVTALSKVGVTFTQSQKEQIKLLTETGDLLGAQKIILEEVQSQVEGSAEAQATEWDKAKVSAGNLAETAGGVLAPALETAASAGAGVADWFSKLDRWQQQLALGLGGAVYVWSRWGDAGLEALNNITAGGGKASRAVKAVNDNIGKAGGLLAAGITSYNLTYEALERLFESHADADELTTSLENLSRGTADVSDVADDLGKDVDDLVGAFERASDAPEGLGESLVYLSTTWDGFKGGGDMRDALDTVEDLDSAMAAMVASGNVEGAAAAHAKLIETLMDEGMTIDEIVPLLPDYYDAVEQAGENAGLAERPIGAMSDALIEQGDAAGDASRWLSGLVDEAADSINVFEAAGDGVRGYYDELFAPLRASIDAEAKLDGITASIIENGRELDINTEKGRANNEALLDYVTTATMAATQTDNSAEAMAGYRQRLIETLEKLGYTSDEVDNLITLMGLTPTDIFTKFTTNAADAKAKVDQYGGPSGWGVPTSWTTDFYARMAGDTWDNVLAILSGNRATSGGSGILGQIGAQNTTPPTRNPDVGPRRVLAGATLGSGAGEGLRGPAGNMTATTVVQLDGRTLQSIMVQADNRQARIVGRSNRLVSLSQVMR